MNTYPIFRLAIFLAVGIFFAETIQLEAGHWPMLLMLCLLVALGLLLKTVPYAYRWMFGAGVSLFMILAGMVLTDMAWKEVKVDWKSEKATYKGVVQESIQEKERTYQCWVTVADKDVLLYLPKDSLSASLRVADEVIFYTRIEPPRNTYLYRKGVSGTAYVPADAWTNVGRSTEMSLKQKALALRERLVKKYREWGVGEEQMPVLSALTLGYKGDLDKETRQNYSVAGISHILALSGMHVGIVWLLMDGLLGLLLCGRFNVLRCVVVILLLWAFAFLVGLEASVVRAVVMCMLLGVGRLSESRPPAMNSLGVAAFFMLLYHPFYLYDVGFQLSFVAVVSILILYPLFVPLVPVKNRWGKKAWEVMAISMSAQLGTAPLVMYYFSSFSVYFLLTNLVVSILVPFIIGLAFLMMVVSPFDGVRWLVVGALDGMVSLLNGMAGWTSGLPYSSVSFSVLNPMEVVVSYVVLAFGTAYWRTGSKVWLIRVLVAVVCLLLLHLCGLCFG